MCIPPKGNVPPLLSTDLLPKTKRYRAVADMLAAAPDNKDNVVRYHQVAAMLLGAESIDSDIEHIALEKLYYCVKNNYAPSSQLLAEYLARH